jgi:predicted HTH domain antitoxin
MKVVFDIPDNLAERIIPAGKDPARAALESVAVDGYRAERLSEEDVREMLGLATRMQVHAVLKEHGAFFNYSVEDFEQDKRTSRNLRAAPTTAASPSAR